MIKFTLLFTTLSLDLNSSCHAFFPFLCCSDFSKVENPKKIESPKPMDLENLSEDVFSSELIGFLSKSDQKKLGQASKKMLFKMHPEAEKRLEKDLVERFCVRGDAELYQTPAIRKFDINLEDNIIYLPGGVEIACHFEINDGRRQKIDPLEVLPEDFFTKKLMPIVLDNLKYVKDDSILIYNYLEGQTKTRVNKYYFFLERQRGGFKLTILKMIFKKGLQMKLEGYRYEPYFTVISAGR